MSWYGIPVGVKVKDANDQVTRHLPDRFQAAVDLVATKTGLTDGDSYREGWGFSDPDERAGTAGDVADLVVAELVEAFPSDRVVAMCGELQASLGGAAE